MHPPPDIFHLHRFVEAQTGIYSSVVAELCQGRKRGHWMWFIFPQIKGLGVSEQSRYYALASLEEARAYWRHSLLGPRLEECTRLVLGHTGCDLEIIFGYVDALKFHSSITLFARATGAAVFQQALVAFFAGREDDNTLTRLTPSLGT